MTDLESPKKNNDCYFYYYSTCAKGDNCTFRHEPSALGCETMCSFWKEGKCLNVHCNFRHMELRKNRKVIPCYWESQPVGCLKAHCPFLHQNPRPSDEVSSEKSNISTETADEMLKEQLNEPSERKVSTVDSLVVNFEEESDNESTPTFSPIKNGNRIVKVKTLEEIKLEKIQAESAAYYSYHGQGPRIQISSDGDDIRQRIVRRIVSKNVLPQERIVTVKTQPSKRIITHKRLSNDDLASILGDDSLRKRQKIVHETGNGNFQIIINKENQESMSMEYQDCLVKRYPLVRSINNPTEANVQNIKIKTLAEIRAERNMNSKVTILDEKDEAEVSSTSADENIVDMRYIENDKDEIKDVSPRRKIKLRRKFPPPQENVVTSNDHTTTNSDNTFSQDRDSVSLETVNNFLQDEIAETRMHSRKFNTTHPLRQESGNNSDDKTDEEILLLEADDEDYDSVPLKGEDELLNEIDCLFSD